MYKKEDNKIEIFFCRHHLYHNVLLKMGYNKESQLGKLPALMEQLLKVLQATNDEIGCPT